MIRTPALETRDVTYCRSGVLLVRRLSVCVDRGEVLVCSGPRGSGVNAALQLLGGELQPDAGRVLVDGVARRSEAVHAVPDPRVVAHGPDRAASVLGDPGAASVLLLDRPLVGLGLTDAHDVLGLARRRADEGAAVVLTTDDVRVAAAYADAVALVVAGRLLAWGPPATVLHPALRILHVGAGAS